MSRDQLDTLLRDLGEREIDAPPFRRVWGAALERRAVRRTRRRLGQAAVAVAAAAALVMVLIPAPTPIPEEGPTPEVQELARSLSEWRAPLDFLLEPPGGSLVGFDPDSPALQVPAVLTKLKIEEIL